MPKTILIHLAHPYHMSLLFCKKPGLILSAGFSIFLLDDAHARHKLIFNFLNAHFVASNNFLYLRCPKATKSE